MLISLIIGAMIMIVFNVAAQSQKITDPDLGIKVNFNPWNKLYCYRDGAFLAGMILVGVGGLAIVGKLGVFDIFSYYPGRKKKENGYKENYGEYVQRKRIERGKRSMYYLSYFYIAAIYLFFSIIALFVTL